MKLACEHPVLLGAQQPGHADACEREHHGYDPKDGELCLARAKAEETLVEARSGSDAQIDHGSWV